MCWHPIVAEALTEAAVRCHWGEGAEAHRLAWPAEIREGFREEVAYSSGLDR